MLFQRETLSWWYKILIKWKQQFISLLLIAPHKIPFIIREMIEKKKKIFSKYCNQAMVKIIYTLYAERCFHVVAAVVILIYSLRCTVPNLRTSSEQALHLVSHLAFLLQSPSWTQKTDHSYFGFLNHGGQNISKLLLMQHLLKETSLQQGSRLDTVVWDISVLRCRMRITCQLDHERESLHDTKEQNSERRGRETGFWSPVSVVYLGHVSFHG